jgi:hypothetical protein
MGIRNFIKNLLKPYLANYFPKMNYFVSGDPAGVQRSQADERTCFDELIAAGFEAYPAETNIFSARREAVAGYLSGLADGEPAFLIDGTMCRELIRGFNGKYKYRRMIIPGEARYTEKPDKNFVSHVSESLQYASLAAQSGIYTMVTEQANENFSIALDQVISARSAVAI